MLLRLAPGRVIAVCAALLLLAAITGLCAGAAVPLAALWSTLTGHADPLVRTVIVDLRLPRILAGALIGASLASCGGGVQALFRNPLAEPGLIGISAGAAVGAAAILASVPAAPPWMLSTAAFAGGALCAGAIVLLASDRGDTRLATLLLAGLALNAIAGALVALLSVLASNLGLRQISLWLFGSLDAIGWQALAAVAPSLLLPSLWLAWRAPALDAMTLGETEAAHLGVPVRRVKREVLICVVLGTGAAVAVSGLIGFIGLLVPHLVRLVSGPRHRTVLVAAPLLGGALLVGADTVARSAFAPIQLPVGILTALLGAPGFLWLLLRARHRMLSP